MFFDHFRRAALARPEALALVYPQRQGDDIVLNYRQLLARVEGLAGTLREAGLKPGQFAGLFLRRCPEHVIAMLAILRCGGAFFSLNPKLSHHQVAHAVKLAQAPLVLVDNAALPRLAQGESPLATQVLHFSDEKFTPAQEKFLARLGAQRLRPPENAPEETVWPVIAPNDAALALFTSGSTGTPKGVVIGQQELLNRVAAECLAYQLSDQDRMLSVLPFSFDVGLNQLLTGLLRNARIVILNSWLPADCCAAIQAHGITCISSVPSLWADLLRHDEAVVREALGQLRYLTISGGDLAPNELQKLQEWCRPAGIFKTYGQSETFRSGLLYPEEFAQKSLTVGRPPENSAVLIVDDQGQPLPPGEEGEVLHRGLGTMLGYLGDPEGSAAKLRPHPCQAQPSPHAQTVVYTGDMGKLDADGFLTILGRRDGMLKIQGNRVYPKEVQDTLLEHLDVAEAAVVGVERDDAWILCAQARLVPEATADETALRQFLQRNLPGYMVPTELTLVSEFPHTASGKIQLAAVRAFFANQ